MHLLERTEELAALERSVRAAADGDGSLLLFEGPAGMGKSSLLAAGRELAGPHGVRVLGARGGELEQAFAFGLVRQLFEPAVARASPESRAHVLQGAAALAAPVVAGGAAQESGDPLAVLHGLYWLTANLAEASPIAIVVDDLQWADGSSLRFLAYLARRLEGLPVAVLGALRPLPSQADPALAELLDDPAARVLHPAPLSPAAAADLADEHLGDAAASIGEASHAATGGNPLLLRELLSAATREMDAEEIRRIAPEVLARRARLTLARLGADAAALVRAVAVLGDDAEPSAVAQLAQLDPARADAAATALADAGLLAARGLLRFAHPLHRAAVYDAIAPGERDAAHARAAEVLRAHQADPGRIAAQLLVAPGTGDADVVEELRRAAAASRAEGAPESAIAYLQRALEEPPGPRVRPEVLVELAQAQVELGTGDPDALREAVGGLSEPRRRAEVGLALARVLFWRADGPGGLAALEAALAEPLPDDDPLRRLLLAERLTVAIRVRELEPAAVAELQALDVPEDSADHGSRSLLALKAYAGAARGGDRDAVVRWAEASLAHGMTDEVASGWGLWGAVSALLMADELDAAGPMVEDAIAFARRRGTVHLFAGASMVRASLAHARGALSEAEADARAAVETAPEREQVVRPLARAQLAQILVERGALDEAETLLADVDVEAALEHTFLALLVRARAQLRLARGDAAGALADLEACGRSAEAFGFRNPAGVPWRSEAAAALIALGDRDRAAVLAEEELALGRAWGAPRGIARPLRVLGLARGGDEGLGLLAESVAVLRDSPADLERARSALQLGAALRRANRKADAREPLREALDRAQRAGAGPLAALAREELLAAGAKPRSKALSGVEALTPSELRVARMAAEGLSNPQIAQALFVTLRTVEMHLSNAFRKLDVRSRTQLPELLG